MVELVGEQGLALDTEIKVELQLGQPDADEIRVFQLSDFLDDDDNRCLVRLAKLVVEDTGLEASLPASFKLLYVDSENETITIRKSLALRRALEKGIVRFVARQNAPDATTGLPFTESVEQAAQLEADPFYYKQFLIEKSHEFRVEQVIKESYCTKGSEAAPEVRIVAANNNNTPIPVEEAGGTLLPAGDYRIGAVYFPVGRFDPYRVDGPVAVDETQKRVDSTGNGWGIAYWTQGFSVGRTVISIRILERGDNRIAIGISQGAANARNWPGYGNDQTGCCLDSSNGKVFRNGCYHRVNAPADRVQNATVISMLLDMDERTLTFYADGERVGLGACNLASSVYYPVVCLFSQGQAVQIEDPPFMAD